MAAVPQEGDIDQGQHDHPKTPTISYCTHYWHIDSIPYQTVRDIGETRVVPEKLAQVRESGQNIEGYVFGDWLFENPN